MNSVFGFALVVLSGVLIWRHVLARQAFNKSQPDDDTAEFISRQFRRRVLTSSLIGVVGISIIAVDWVTPSPIVFTVFVIGWLLILGVILLSALVDMISTRAFLRRMSISHRARHAELQAEVERLRQLQRTGDENGKGSK